MQLAVRSIFNWRKVEILPINCEPHIPKPDSSPIRIRESIVYLGGLLHVFFFPCCRWRLWPSHRLPKSYNASGCYSRSGSRLGPAASARSSSGPGSWLACGGAGLAAPLQPESPTTVSSRRRWLRLAVPAGPVGLARAQAARLRRCATRSMAPSSSTVPGCGWPVRVSGDTRVASQHKAPPIGDAP